MRRRRRKRPLRLILAVVLLIAGGLLGLRQMAEYKPPASPVVTPFRAAEARIAVDRAQRTIKDVAKAAHEGKRKPFRVNMKDDALTTYIASDPKLKHRLAAKGMRDARFRFEDNRVTVSGFMKYHGRQAYVTVSGKPEASASGRVKLASVSVLVGKLSVPILAPRAERMLDDMFRSGEARLPANVTAITAENGELTLRGISRPE